MTDPTPDVSALALSILELLDERPMHPYELAQTMRDRHHDEFVRLNFGSLYHTVDVLERNGWIVPTEREKEGGRPERTIYTLTPAGEDVLVRMVGDMLARPRREYLQFSAGLMFMHHITSAEASQHLRTRAIALKALTAKLSTILEELHKSGHSRLWVIELEHKIALLEAERKWVVNLEKEISDGTLEWDTGIESGDEKLMRRGHGSSTH